MTGSATQAAKEPLIAKTIKIRIIWKLEVMPQRVFNFSIKNKYTGKNKGLTIDKKAKLDKIKKIIYLVFYLSFKK